MFDVFLRSIGLDVLVFSLLEPLVSLINNRSFTRTFIFQCKHKKNNFFLNLLTSKGFHAIKAH